MNRTHMYLLKERTSKKESIAMYESKKLVMFSSGMDVSAEHIESLNLDVTMIEEILREAGVQFDA